MSRDYGTTKDYLSPGRSKIIQRSSRGPLLTSMIIASLKQNQLLKMMLIFHVRFTCLTLNLTGTSTEWIQLPLPVFSTAPISGYLICMDRAVLSIFWTLLVKKTHRLFNLSKRSDTWSQEKDPDTTKYGQIVYRQLIVRIFPCRLRNVCQSLSRGRGAWANFCWVCATSLSERLPHYSLFCDQL